MYLTIFLCTFCLIFRPIAGNFLCCWNFKGVDRSKPRLPAKQQFTVSSFRGGLNLSWELDSLRGSGPYSTPRKWQFGHRLQRAGAGASHRDAHSNSTRRRPSAGRGDSLVTPFRPPAPPCPRSTELLVLTLPAVTADIAIRSSCRAIP